VTYILRTQAEETAFQQLIRHWMNERHAPDILYAQERLLARLLDHIKKQVSVIRLPSLLTQCLVVVDGNSVTKGNREKDEMIGKIC
jgi:hypothetical protein